MHYLHVHQKWTSNKQPCQQHYFCGEESCNVTYTAKEGALPVQNVQVEAGKHTLSWAAC